MLEHRTEPLLSFWKFVLRIGTAIAGIVFLAALSLLIGTFGYRFLAGSDWSDAFHLACLVLGNHDIALHPESTAGRVFGGVYVMYARLVFVSMIAILVAPILHRILHILHLETDEDGSRDGEARRTPVRGDG